MNKLQPFMLLCAVLALPLGKPALADGQGPVLPSFELRDQFGRQQSTKDLEGRVVIVVGGDREGQKWSREWAQEIEALLSGEQDRQVDIELLRVADLSGTPKIGLVERRVTRALRDRQASILLDWQGVLARALGFEPGVANVVLVGRDGRAVYRAHVTAVQRGGLVQLEQTITSQVERSRSDCSLNHQSHYVGTAGLR